MKKLLGIAGLVLAVVIAFKLVAWTFGFLAATAVFVIKLGLVLALVGAAYAGLRRLTRGRRRPKAPRQLGERSSTLDFLRGRVDKDEYLRSQRRL